MIALATLLAETNTSFEFRLNPITSIIGLALLAFGIYVCVDASKYPDAAFTAVGSKKSTWQIWPVVGGLCCGIAALIMGIIWFSSKKAAVEAAARGGAGGGMPPMAPPPPPVG